MRHFIRAKVYSLYSTWPFKVFFWFVLWLLLHSFVGCKTVIIVAVWFKLILHKKEVVWYDLGLTKGDLSVMIEVKPEWMTYITSNIHENI